MSKFVRVFNAIKVSPDSDEKLYLIREIDVEKHDISDVIQIFDDYEKLAAHYSRLCLDSSTMVYFPLLVDFMYTSETIFEYYKTRMSELEQEARV